jgi:ABC-2 type transport system permease protein
MTTTPTTTTTTAATTELFDPPRAIARRESNRFIKHSGYLTMRLLRALVRQPWYLAITLVQPMIWLLLFGQLFRSVIHIPGFATTSGSYLEFITPGVIMMTVLFSSAWAGTVYIEDMNRGVMDRLLASRASRGAMMVGTLAYQAITILIQTLIVFGIAYATGARFPGGVSGIALTLVAAALLSVIFAAMSNAVALLVRQQEALIGISQFVSLPLSFLCSAFMAIALAPDWVQQIARYNPMEWAVVISRQTLSTGPDWGTVLPRLGWLGLLALVMAWLATRAFRSYQRSV